MRLFKYLITGTLVFAATLLLGVKLGYAGNPENSSLETKLRIALENDVQTLDPVRLTDPYTSRIVWQIYEGLIGLDAKDLTPLIAESWEARDNYKTWSFKIRDAVFFHKAEFFPGTNKTRKVTAHDVVYSYERFAGALGSFIFSGLVEGFDSYISKRAKNISGFRALDDRTFEIHLVRSEPAFLYRLTSPFLSIMPKEAVDQGVEKFGKSLAIGTGPFRLVRRSDTEVELEKNPDYWRSISGNIKEILFRVIKNSQFRVAEFEKGNLDVILLPTNMIPQFMDKGEKIKNKYIQKFSVTFQPTYNIHFIGINNKLVSDIPLRRAIAMAIDTDQIIKTILNGAAIRAKGPVFPGMLGYESPDNLQNDIKKARDELKKSGYSGKTLKLLVHDASNSELVGQIVQSQLSKIGVNITLEKVDFNTAMGRVFSGNTPDLFSMFFEWIYGAPDLIFDIYRSNKIPSPNVAAYKNKKTDNLIQQAINDSQREKINQILFQAEKNAHEDSPYVWLYHAQNVLLYRKDLSNVAINPHNHWLISEIRMKKGR